MPHLAVPILLALGTLAAGAEPPGVTTRAPASLQVSLVETMEERACPGALEPAGWRDPSSAWFFVTSPTARQDDQELAAGAIVPLASLRFVEGALRLFVLGSPLQARLQFTGAGWHPRWPFC